MKLGFRRSADRSRGYSLTELMIAVTILSIVMIVMVRVMRQLTQSTTSHRARATILLDSERIARHISEQIVQSKRIFDGTTVNGGSQPGFLYLSRCSRSRDAMPPVGIGNGNGNSRLPIWGAALSPSVVSDPANNIIGFDRTKVGNMLFMAVSETPIDVNGGAKKLDVYRFFIYFVAYESLTIDKQKRRDLYEWQSCAFVDWDQFSALTPPEQIVARAAIQTRGLPYGWRIGEDNPNNAFFLVSSNAPLPGLNIPEVKVTNLSKALIASAPGSFHTSISPNTLDNAPIKVPLYGLKNPVNPDFPSGFEVVFAGSPGARQILIHLVVAAEGAFPGVMRHETTVVNTARDIY